MTDDEIRAYLEDAGYPPHVVMAGREGLLRRWREFVDEVERGYQFGIEDYRNDLDARGVIALLDLDSAVGDEDRRFAEMLVSTDVRVWESMAADPFWDFGYPRNARGRLLEELRSAGLVE